MELTARLRAFAAVARHDSFSRAAVELGISQPAVSKHVADLERELQVQLVVRHPRGARLTPAGTFLAGYVERAEALLAQAARGVAAMAGGSEGRLAVAASGTPGTYLLPRAIAAMARDRPGIELRLDVSTSADVVEAVRAHRVEIGIVGGFAGAPDLDSEALLEDELVVVGPPEMRDLTLTMRQLEAQTWVFREEGSATRAVVEAAWSAIGLEPTRRLALPSWELVKLTVACGAGIAAVSRFGIELEIATGRLAVLSVPDWHVVRPWSLIRARDVPLTPAAELFSAAVRDAARQMVAAYVRGADPARPGSSPE
jgi:DNA-binding transcriptional LysR family regulator